MRFTADDAFLDPGSKALLTALAERDSHTRNHSKRVMGFAHLLGLRCNLDEDDLMALSIGAYFHDIGKIGIPDSILLKPNRFSPDEMEVMKSHPEKGEGIVKELGLKLGQAVAQAVRHHHEHVDGGGYPDGLEGEGIPYIARIISVADSFDAMTESRPYHPARSASDALEIMQSESGSKLDPYLVAKLRELIQSKHAGLVALLDKSCV